MNIDCRRITRHRFSVVVSPEDKTLTFTDDGLGMTEDEVEEYINQIAFSGATGFPGEV